MYLESIDVAHTCLDLPLEVRYLLGAFFDFVGQVLDDTAFPRQQVVQRAGRAFEFALVSYTGIVEALERRRGRVRVTLKLISIVHFAFGNRQNALLQLLQLVGVGVIFFVLLIVFVNPDQKITVVRRVDSPAGILSSSHMGQYFAGLS